MCYCYIVVSRQVPITGGKTNMLDTFLMKVGNMIVADSVALTDDGPKAIRSMVCAPCANLLHVQANNADGTTSWQCDQCGRQAQTTADPVPTVQVQEFNPADLN